MRAGVAVVDAGADAAGAAETGAEEAEARCLEAEARAEAETEMGELATLTLRQAVTARQLLLERVREAESPRHQRARSGNGGGPLGAAGGRKGMALG